MRFLFLNPSFPGQFLHLAHHLGASGNQVVFLSMKDEPGQLQGVSRFVYKPVGQLSPGTHPYLSAMERAIMVGQSAYRAAAQLKTQGFVPHAIIGQANGGSTMYMKDLFPRVPLINHFEWFYRAQGAKVGAQEQQSTGEECKNRTQNGPILLDLYNCDIGVIPTFWQHFQFPAEYARKLKVLCDGVNTAAYIPRPAKKFVLPRIGLDLSNAKEIVTYSEYGLAPDRRMLHFWESIVLVQRQRPDCQIVIVGTEDLDMLIELPIDFGRLHFTGRLNSEEYLMLLQASTAYVHLSSSFILSGSMLAAMSCGCALIATATQPVQEVVLDGVNGLLTDCSSSSMIAKPVIETLTDPVRRGAMAHRARETILDRFDLRQTLPRHLNLIQQMIESAPQ